MGWSTMVYYVDIPRLRGANGQKLRIQGVIVMYIRLCDLTVKNNFVVADSLPIPLILRTKYIDKHPRVIISPELRIVLQDYPPVVILST